MAVAITPHFVPVDTMRGGRTIVGANVFEYSKGKPYKEAIARWFGTLLHMYAENVLTPEGEPDYRLSGCLDVQAGRYLSAPTRRARLIERMEAACGDRPALAIDPGTITWGGLMLKGRCLVVIASLALLGACVDAPPPSVAAERQWSRWTNMKLADFRQEADAACDSSNLAQAERGARNVARYSVPTLENHQLAASLLLDVADAAADKGCQEHARALYRGVIREYVGTGYVAHRQRAEIGLADLRAQGGISN